MEVSNTVEDCLRDQLSFLKDLSDDLSLIKSASPNSRTVKVINEALVLLGNFKECSSSLRCFSLIEEITEIYLSHGKGAARQLIFSVLEQFIDAIICARAISNRMELLRILNLLLEECSVKVAQELLKKKEFCSKIENLLSQLFISGDFEMQVLLIESILRLLPKKSYREKYLQNSFGDGALLSSFLKIRDEFFDVDCRKFLNELNQNESSSSHRIFSFPVLNAKLDGEQLFKPDDKDYDDFWIDFNSKSERITLFCQSTLLPSQLSQNKEPRWETLSLRAKDVKRFTCNGKEKLWLVTVELKENAQMLTNREPEKLPHLFICQLSKIYDVEIALSSTLKKEKVKVSIPDDSLSLEGEDKDAPVPVEKSNLKTDHLLENDKGPLRSYELPSSIQSLKSQKSSVPLESMSIVTSSISSTDGSKSVAWQALYHQLNKRKLKGKHNYHETFVKPNSQNDNLNSVSHLSEKNANPLEQDRSFGKNPDIPSLQTYHKSTKAEEQNKKNPNSVRTEGYYYHISKPETECSDNKKIEETVSDIPQTPITASGDYICHQKKSKIRCQKSEKGMLNTSNNSPSNSLITEGRKYDQLMKSTKTKKNDLMKLSSQDRKVNSKQQVTQEVASLSRRCSLRSKKQISIPGESLMPIPSKCTEEGLECTNSVDKRPTHADFSKDMQAKEKSKKDEISPLSPACTSQKETKIQPQTKSSTGTAFITLNEAIRSNKQKTKDNGCNQFKSPKTCNILKNHGTLQKGKRKQDEFDAGSEQTFKPVCDMSKGELKSNDKSKINRLKIRNSDDSTQTKYLWTVSHQTESNNIAPTFPQSLSYETPNKSLSAKSFSSGFCNKSNHSKSSSEGELFIEIVKSIGDAEPEINEDHVDETQINESSCLQEIRERKTQPNSCSRLSKPEESNKAEDGGFHSSFFQNVVKISETQASNTVTGSYVFNKNSKEVNKDKQCHDLQSLDMVTNDKKCAQKCKNVSHGKENTVKSNSKTTLKENKAKSKKWEIDIPESSPTVTSSNDITTKVDEQNNTFPVNKLKLSCQGNLRSRNKNICYTECDSLPESRAHEGKNYSPNLLAKTNDKSKIEENKSPGYRSRPYLGRKIECSVSKQMGCKNQSQNLSWSSKMGKNKDIIQNYKIWRSQEIKTTFTSVPGLGSSDCISDPYDFEYECQKECNSFKSILPRKCSFDYKHRESSQEDKHQNSNKSSKYTNEFEEIVSSSVKSVNVEFLRKTEKICQDYESEDKLNDSLRNQAELSNLTSKSQKRNSKDRVADEKDDHGSQDAHLNCTSWNDPISCTAQCDITSKKVNHNVYSFCSRSRGTELSWIAKARISPRRKKQMRGRTYGLEKRDQNAHKAHEVAGNLNSERMLPSSLNKMQKTVKRKLSYGKKGKEKKNRQWKRTIESEYLKLPELKHSHNFILSKKDKLKKTPRSIPRCEGELRDKYKSYIENVSGPSFSPRLSLSTLKRKYPNVSSDSGERISYSDSESELLSDRQHKFVPRKLFDSVTSNSKRLKTENSNHLKNLNDDEDCSYEIEESRKSRNNFKVISDEECSSEVKDSCIMEDHTNDLNDEEDWNDKTDPHRMTDCFNHLIDEEDMKDTHRIRDHFYDFNNGEKRKSKEKDSHRLLYHKDLNDEEDISNKKKDSHNMRYVNDLNEEEDLSNERKDSHAMSDHSIDLSDEEDWRSKTKDYLKLSPHGRNFVSFTKGTLEKSCKQTPKLGGNNKFLSDFTPKEGESIWKSDSRAVTGKNPLLASASFDSPQTWEEDLNIDNFEVKSISSGAKSYSQVSSFGCGENLSISMKSQERHLKGKELNAWNERNENCLLENDDDVGHLHKSTTDLNKMEKMNIHSAGQSESSSTTGTAPEMLKSTKSIMNSSMTEIKGRRSQAMKRFDQQFLSVFSKINKLFKESKESENKTMILLTQHLQRLKSQRELSKQSLESLKHACEELLNEIKENSTSQDKVKKSVKSALKKDFNALSMNINSKFNAFSLEAMRRCLQVSIMLS